MIRSTMYRVVQPSLKGKAVDVGHPVRYSVTYFGNLELIEALPGTWEVDKGEKKYEGVNSEEYLLQRLTITFG